MSLAGKCSGFSFEFSCSLEWRRNTGAIECSTGEMSMLKCLRVGQRTKSKITIPLKLWSVSVSVNSNMT